MVEKEAGVELQLAQGLMGQCHILLKNGSTGSSIMGWRVLTGLSYPVKIGVKAWGEI